MFVELESVNSSITTKNGELGTSIRKGIIQVNDWRNWLEANFSYLRNTFMKYKSDFGQIPEELSIYDSTRITYAVVAGRRGDFSEKTYRSRRKLLTESRIVLIHYDNLVDYSQRMISENGFGGMNYITKNGVSENYKDEN